MVNYFKVLVTHPDTTMGDRQPQEALVKSSVNEITLTEIKCIVTQYAVFKTGVMIVFRDRQTILHECPVRFFPDRRNDLSLDPVFSPGSPENPLLGISVF